MDKMIKSVLGFNLKAEIKDIHGNIIPTGCRKSIIITDGERNVPKILDRKFFTHFDDALLNKIREYRRLND